jgi:DNA topoisomerase-1
MVAVRPLDEVIVPPGLRYVTDSTPGIRRLRRGKSFSYTDAQGKKITAERTLFRIRSLVIPPAWENVWICPLENGHIQATGRDARGRKQYRYHSKWREHRDETKYGLLPQFGKCLDTIRRRVKRDLALRGLPREKVLAAIVRLLESTMIRVGNDEYARTNSSYGLTTLLDQHVRFERGSVRFKFRGKSGVQRDVQLRDAQLAKVVKSCQDIPGQILFQYLDESGERCRVDSGEVNAYLREISGYDFTAKYFRTWGGTLSAMCSFAGKPKPESEAAAKREITAVIKATAHALGNTATVCRKYYIHPVVIDAYRNGRLTGACERGAAERTLLRLLA